MTDYERGIRDAIEFMNTHSISYDTSEGGTRTANGHYRISVKRFERDDPERATRISVMHESAVSHLVREASNG